MSAGEAAAFIRQHRRFLLLCHVSPDGDALGSSLALGLALEAAGREWTAACDTVCYPHKYAFLPGADRVHVGTPVTPEPDTALILWTAPLPTGRGCMPPCWRRNGPHCA